MNDEVRQIIAFLFKRSGKKEIKLSEACLTLSMELNWFSPEDAKIFINSAIKNQDLKEKNNAVYPAFDIDEIEIPVGFKPSLKIKEISFDEKKPIKEDLVFDKIIDLIGKNTKNDKKRIIEEVRLIKKEKNIEKEVAALLFAKKYNVALNEFYEEITETIFKENIE